MERGELEKLAELVEDDEQAVGFVLGNQLRVGLQDESESRVVGHVWLGSGQYVSEIFNDSQFRASIEGIFQGLKEGARYGYGERLARAGDEDRKEAGAILSDFRQVDRLPQLRGKI